MFCSIYGDMMSSVRLFTLERYTVFRYLSPEFVFNDAKILFYNQNGSYNPKLYSLCISATSKEKKLHVSNFS